MRAFSCTAEVSVNGSSDHKEFPQETSEVLRESFKEPLLSSEDYLISVDPADQLALPCTRDKPKVKQVPFIVKCVQQSKMFAQKINLNKILAPSTCGVIVGFIVGLVPPVRNAMIGDSAPLRVILSSVNLVGQGTIPIMTLLVGGNLLKGLTGTGMKKRIVVSIILVRYIFMPLIGILVVKGAHHIGFVHSDPLYQFVLLLQFALPPAMSISTVTQLFSAGENECSVIMLWTYIFASLAITLWATFYMWLVAA
ncbi:Auxin efflux carrier family protein [Thalictrum thalictroides]|uniref:Auxin efflux carrier family protein n=1 Tax=Thalictrum thalictroides TaxID=46969 RepID=A0A7J6VHJ8_THATH|nr:Auxin efflux carrier family protein [Thalictrum thalictroides]